MNAFWYRADIKGLSKYSEGERLNFYWFEKLLRPLTIVKFNLFLLDRHILLPVMA